MPASYSKPRRPAFGLSFFCSLVWPTWTVPLSCFHNLQRTALGHSLWSLCTERTGSSFRVWWLSTPQKFSHCLQRSCEPELFLPWSWVDWCDSNCGARWIGVTITQRDFFLSPYSLHSPCSPFCLLIRWSIVLESCRSRTVSTEGTDRRHSLGNDFRTMGANLFQAVSGLDLQINESESLAA